MEETRYERVLIKTKSGIGSDQMVIEYNNSNILFSGNNLIVVQDMNDGTIKGTVHQLDRVMEYKLENNLTEVQN